jgi:hypothetical protein
MVHRILALAMIDNIGIKKKGLGPALLDRADHVLHQRRVHVTGARRIADRHLDGHDLIFFVRQVSARLFEQTVQGLRPLCQIATCYGNKINVWFHGKSPRFEGFIL